MLPVFLLFFFNVVLDYQNALWLQVCIVMHTLRRSFQKCFVGEKKHNYALVIFC